MGEQSLNLVSVVVVTYNSSKTVLATLDSIYCQSYSALELIISDDCSKDDTVHIVDKWINKYKNRFVNCIFVKSQQNTGVAANLNRAMNKCSGSWIKPIAGDDLLPKSCIHDYLKFVLNNNIETICNALSIEFVEEKNSYRVIGYRPEPYIKEIYNSDAHRQLCALVGENICLLGCTNFISREFYTSVGGFDESFPQIEDWPFYINITSKGYKVFFADEFVGCFHRVGDNSLSNTRSGFFNEKTYGKNGVLDNLQNKYCIPRITGVLQKIHINVDKRRRYFIIYRLNNAKNTYSEVLSKTFLFFSPLAIKRKIYNKLHKESDINFKKFQSQLNEVRGAK